jgi:hypothetical protein
MPAEHFFFGMWPSNEFEFETPDKDCATKRSQNGTDPNWRHFRNRNTNYNKSTYIHAKCSPGKQGVNEKQ